MFWPNLNSAIKVSVDIIFTGSRSQWPRGLKVWVCGRSLAGITGSNPAGAWMSASCQGCVLSGRGLCDGLINRPEESY